MNPTALALAELRKQIEANKTLLAEQEAALAVLERMLVNSTQVSMHMSRLSESLSEPAAMQQDVFDIKQLAQDDLGGTLKDSVLDVVKRFGEQEFTGAHVHAALEKSGVLVNGKYPRSRIAMALSKLEAEKKVFRSYTGSGKIPHRYKFVRTENLDTLI